MVTVKKVINLESFPKRSEYTTDNEYSASVEQWLKDQIKFSKSLNLTIEDINNLCIYLEDIRDTENKNYGNILKETNKITALKKELTIISQKVKFSATKASDIVKKSEFEFSLIRNEINIAKPLYESAIEKSNTAIPLCESAIEKSNTAIPLCESAIEKSNTAIPLCKSTIEKIKTVSINTNLSEEYKNEAKAFRDEAQKDKEEIKAYKLDIADRVNGNFVTKAALEKVIDKLNIKRIYDDVLFLKNDDEVKEKFMVLFNPNKTIQDKIEHIKRKIPYGVRIRTFLPFQSLRNPIAVKQDMFKVITENEEDIYIIFHSPYLDENNNICFKAYFSFAENIKYTLTIFEYEIWDDFFEGVPINFGTYNYFQLKVDDLLKYKLFMHDLCNLSESFRGIMPLESNYNVFGLEGELIDKDYGSFETSIFRYRRSNLTGLRGR